MSCLNLLIIHELPAVMNMSDDDLEKLSTNKLKITHPCHNQAVERHVKLVSKVSMSFEGFGKRDGMIRQGIKSPMLMPCYNTKKQLNS